MNKFQDFCQFIDNNKKLYINSNTGKGKTLLASLLALFFLETHINFKVISNYKLNIYNKKTNKSMCEYTKFGLLPFSKLTKGNYLIIIDDFKAVKQYLKNFGSILAILSRKLNVYVIITLHYYTHMIKENREMFNQEVQIELTKLQYNPKKHQIELTDKSNLKAIFIEPNSLFESKKQIFRNVLRFVKGNIALNNVYIKGKLYNTYEIVEFANQRKIIQEISNFSNSINDLEQNIGLFTSNKREYKSIFNKLMIEKGF
jgi:hypothetical protein